MTGLIICITKKIDITLLGNVLMDLIRSLSCLTRKYLFNKTFIYMSILRLLAILVYYIVWSFRILIAVEIDKGKFISYAVVAYQTFVTVGNQIQCNSCFLLIFVLIRCLEITNSKLKDVLNRLKEDKMADITTEVNNISKLYSKIFYLSTKFTSIFGWYFLVIIFKTFIYTVTQFYYGFHVIMAYNKVYFRLLLSCMSPLSNFIEALFTIILIVRLQQQYQKVLRLLEDVLLADHTQTAKLEVEALHLQLLQQNFKFNICGLFAVEMYICIAIFSVSFNYVIIFIQFEKM